MAIDPVTAAAGLVSQIQTIVARRVVPRSPAVVSTTYLEAGKQVALNVIPATSRLGGSIRTTDDETRAVVRSSLEKFVAGLESANPGLTAELDYLVGYDAVLNDPACTAVVRELAAPIWGEDAIIEEPAMLGGRTSRRSPAWPPPATCSSGPATSSSTARTPAPPSGSTRPRSRRRSPWP